MESQTYRLAKTDGYCLAKGQHRATARLNLQYFLLQRTFNFTIHPSIDLPENPVVADVATGTGLWALDLLRERPTATVDGFDLDITQCPPNAWLPSNLRVNTWNILQEPAQEFHGKYDLVHVRLIFLVLAANEPGLFIRYMHSLLKPGGWLQWEELDATQMHVKRVSQDVSTPALDAVIRLKTSGGQHEWVREIPNMLEKQGFVECSKDECDDPVELGRAFTDMHLMTVEEIAAHMLEQSGGDVSKETFARQVLGFAEEGYRESLRGAALSYPRICYRARKA